MNVKTKIYFMGLLLLIIQPIAMANTYFYPYIKSYSNCSITILDDEDNSVEVSFRAHLVDDLFADKNSHIEQWEQLINASNGESITLSPEHALLSLYFYKADGSPEINITLNAISGLSLNGVSHNNSGNNIQKITFNSGANALNNTYYDVSFKVSSHALPPIRIGATVGGVLNRDQQQHSLLSLKGVSFGSTGKQCENFEPQTAVAPEAIKVDPKFRLSSAIWKLKPVDLDLLLDNTENGSGLNVPLDNSEANRFCIHYQPMGVKRVIHRIQANNLNGLSKDRNHFQLKDKEKVINYQVILRTEYSSSDFFLPEDYYLTDLDKDVKKMCWTPKIQLFSTETTDKGSYSDTLNFTIMPLA